MIVAEVTFKVSTNAGTSAYGLQGFVEALHNKVIPNMVSAGRRELTEKVYTSKFDVKVNKINVEEVGDEQK